MPYNDLPKIDKYALFQLETVMASMKDSYESYQFYKVYQVCLHFVCLCQFHIFDLFFLLLLLSLNIVTSICTCAFSFMQSVFGIGFHWVYFRRASGKQKVCLLIT